MKNSPICVLTLLAALVFSCNEKPANTSTTDQPENTEVAINKDSLSNGNQSITPGCYINTFNKDTAFLQLAIDNNVVTGELEYKRFEKDQNKGAITGSLHGDTLVADYTFNSEGTTSVRQVVFVKKGDLLVEGYGEVAEVNGRTTFKNPGSLTFDDKMAMRKTVCK